MPHPDAPPLTRAVVLRTIGFAVAIALGAVAVWLIVIADSTKSMRLGALAGIWGALLGAYAMFGARRHGPDADEPARSVSDVPVLSAQEIAVRPTNDVERVAEAAARRAFEDRLEQMLRREIGREVSDLRSEIARLRQDLLDKVGGQLRLERIETTRVIGSDLEALQHEVRQLKQASETGAVHDLALGTSSVRTVVEPAKVRPISRPSAEAAADIKPARAAHEPAVVNVEDVEEVQDGEEVDEPGTDEAGDPARTDTARTDTARTDTARTDTARTDTARTDKRTDKRTETARAEQPRAEKPGRPSAAPREAEPARQPARSAAWSPPAAASNGAARTSAAGNGAARNGAIRRAAERDDSSASKPAETTGPIRSVPPEDAARPDAPSTAARSTRRPAGPTPPAPWQPTEAWTPPVPPARTQPADKPVPAAAATPPQAAKPTPPKAEKPGTAPKAEKRATPPPAEKPATPPPAAAPAPVVRPASEDPFASLPRITPFTEFELDPVDTATHTRDPRAAAAAGPASPVVPANPAYTGRRRRTDGGDPDAGRHSRSGPAAAEPDTGGGRRRRTDEPDVEDDLLSRLLARGSAER